MLPRNQFSKKIKPSENLTKLFLLLFFFNFPATFSRQGSCRSLSRWKFQSSYLRVFQRNFSQLYQLWRLHPNAVRNSLGFVASLRPNKMTIRARSSFDGSGEQCFIIWLDDSQRKIAYKMNKKKKRRILVTFSVIIWLTGALYFDFCLQRVSFFKQRKMQIFWLTGLSAPCWLRIFLCPMHCIIMSHEFARKWLLHWKLI